LNPRPSSLIVQLYMHSRLFILQSCANRRAQFRSDGLCFRRSPTDRAFAYLNYLTSQIPKVEQLHGSDGNALSGDCELIIVGDYQICRQFYEMFYKLGMHPSASTRGRIQIVPMAAIIPLP
jgi:hypothetical protein